MRVGVEGKAVKRLPLHQRKKDSSYHFFESIKISKIKIKIENDLMIMLTVAITLHRI